MCDYFIIVFGKKRKARAFTLLELFLVLAVLVSLAAIVWPSLGGERRIAKLKYSAKQLAILFQFARNGAMAEGREYRCVFKRNGGKVMIESQSEASGQGGSFEPIKAHWALLDLRKDDIRCVSVELDEWEKLLKEQEREIVEEDENIVSEYEPINFYPDGQADSAVIVLGDSENNFVSLEFNGLTGETNIVEGNISSENEKASR